MLPEPALLARVKSSRVPSDGDGNDGRRGALARGARRRCHYCQGCEAGGHRGMFLSANLGEEAAPQPSALALVPQIADAVGVPIIAAGGIADGRRIAAAFAIGAAGVQIGTA